MIARGKQPLEMEVDTGASMSVISEKNYENLISGRRALPLETFGLVLLTFTGEEIKPKGSCMVNVCHDGRQYCLPLLVVCGEGPSLLGRDWLGVIKLNWPKIKLLSSRKGSCRNTPSFLRRV